MARSRNGFLNTLTVLPWPVGVVAGIVFFVVIREIFPTFFVSRNEMISQGLAQAAGHLWFIPWFLLILCWGAAFLSWMEARKRRQLLDTRSDLESIAKIGWRQFEHLVGEAFRRRGYSVEDTGLGADGGIDLILRCDGKRVLVQCKQWKQQQVGVKVVREMYGLLAHHNASEVKIASLGTYTREAEQFATGKPIELIDGETLLAMIREVQTSKIATPASALNRSIEPAVVSANQEQVSSTPPCPRCGRPTVQRRNRTTGETFLGCSGFPQCRGAI